jgi:hypothetical protein
MTFKSFILLIATFLSGGICFAQSDGIKYVFYQSPGTSHEWLTWRRDLEQFAQLLFKNK